MKAFVLSGGGNLGSLQAGMLTALLEAGIVPDMLVGTSIGAVNAAFLAANPSLEQAVSLCEMWTGLRSREVFSWNPIGIGAALWRRGALLSPKKWRRFLERRIPYQRIEDAAVPPRHAATDFDDSARSSLSRFGPALPTQNAARPTHICGASPSASISCPGQSLAASYSSHCGSWRWKRSPPDNGSPRRPLAPDHINTTSRMLEESVLRSDPLAVHDTHPSRAYSA